MVNINFNSIRTLNGKQDEAFEELVCQLARCEKPAKAKRFIRKGKPEPEGDRREGIERLTLTTGHRRSSR